MRKIAIAVLLFLCPSASYAQWSVGPGNKVSAMRDDKKGIVAKLLAKNSPQGVSAYLQIECFEHPDLSGRTLSIVLSKETAPGPLGWRFQFDNQPEVKRGPFTRLSLNVTSLGNATSEEFRGLLSAKLFRVTLLPPTGPHWSFDFDVSGARNAANSVPCKEFKR